MEILSIQSRSLGETGIIYPDPSKCNHPDSFEVYKRLFGDYNQKKGTNYNHFFWGFSELRQIYLKDKIQRAIEMIGIKYIDGHHNVLIMEIPDELCLETDFYNFADEIYAYRYPGELESIWESIYEKRDAERQVIFPYIDSTWIKQVIHI